MGKWEDLRSHFTKQAQELDEDDDCAIFALEVLDLMDALEFKYRDTENEVDEGKAEV